MARLAAPFNPLAEIVGMDRDSLTDRMLLTLHIRQITSAGQAANSIRAREGAVLRLRRYLDPQEENPTVLCDAAATDLVKWQCDMDHLAPASVDKYLSHVMLYYAWLVRPMKVLKESPAEDLVRPIVPKRQPRPISEENLTFALECCSDDEMFAWLILGGYAGLRAFDISALDADDLIESGPVPLLRVRGKGGDEKLVAVGELVVGVIKPFCGRRGPMFRSVEGRRYKAPTIDKRINAFLASIGLLERFHTLRHRYCTKTYEITQDIRYTQLQARHASVATTQVYTLVSQDRRPDALADLDKILAARVTSRERRRA